jgi:hypothetical protein
MKLTKNFFLTIIIVTSMQFEALGQSSPDQLNFVRQGVRRMIFDEDQSIPLASLNPNKIIGFSAMHPTTHYSEEQAEVNIIDKKLVIKSKKETQTNIWFGGFNSFATYTINLDSSHGNGEVGFEFSDGNKKEQFIITTQFEDSMLTGVKLKVKANSKIITNESIVVSLDKPIKVKGKIILQMLGSGLSLLRSLLSVEA